jgi:hypothetical protein
MTLLCHTDIITLTDECKAHHIPMSTRLQGGLPKPFPGGDKGPLLQKTRKTCFDCVSSPYMSSVDAISTQYHQIRASQARYHTY